MKKELVGSQDSYSFVDLFRTPTMRLMTISLSAVWYDAAWPANKNAHSRDSSPSRFSTSFAYYGLSMDLQKFGVDIYLIQVIFGAVDIPAKVVITVSMSLLGRRPSQCGALVVAGVTILANLLVPHGRYGSAYRCEGSAQLLCDALLAAGDQTVRTGLAVLGKGCLAASFNCCYLYSGELYPTVIR